MIAKVKPSVHSDSYWEDISRSAIDEAIQGSEGKSLAEIRLAISQSCPFDRKQNVKGYKIFRRLKIQRESELGILPQTTLNILKRQASGLAPQVKRKQQRQGLAVAEAGTLSELHEKYLMPATADEASIFLRRYTSSVVFMLEDTDELRVTLKCHDLDASKAKCQFAAELPTDDAELREQRYIQAAQRAWEFWIKLEAEKF